MMFREGLLYKHVIGTMGTIDRGGNLMITDTQRLTAHKAIDMLFIVLYWCQMLDGLDQARAPQPDWWDSI